MLLALDDLTELLTKLMEELPATINNCEEVENGDSQYANGSGTSFLELDRHQNILDRFGAAKANATAEDPEKRDFARRSLIAAIRDIVEGVVLQSGLTITIHIRPDAAGRRVVYIVGREGLQGAQVKSPDGTTGFVDRSVLIGAVSRAVLASDDQQSAADQALRSARLVYSAEGDWQIAAPDPMQMVDVVARAESLLRA